MINEIMIKKYRKGKVFEKHIYIKKLLSKVYKELITYWGFPDGTTVSAGSIRDMASISRSG